MRSAGSSRRKCCIAHRASSVRPASAWLAAMMATTIRYRMRFRRVDLDFSKKVLIMFLSPVEHFLRRPMFDIVDRNSSTVTPLSGSAPDRFVPESTGSDA